MYTATKIFLFIIFISQSNGKPLSDLDYLYTNPAQDHTIKSLLENARNIAIPIIKRNIDNNPPNCHKKRKKIISLINEPDKIPKLNKIIIQTLRDEKSSLWSIRKVLNGVREGLYENELNTDIEKKGLELVLKNLEILNPIFFDENKCTAVPRIFEKAREIARPIIEFNINRANDYNKELNDAYNALSCELCIPEFNRNIMDMLIRKKNDFWEIKDIAEGVVEKLEESGIAEKLKKIGLKLLIEEYGPLTSNFCIYAAS